MTYTSIYPKQILEHQPEINQSEILHQIAKQNQRLIEADRMILKQKQELERLRLSMEMQSTFTIYFNSASAELSREAKMQLASYLGEGSAVSINYLVLSASEDKFETEKYINLRNQRCESVKKFLIEELNFNGDQIRIQNGDRREHSIHNEFLNRTVVISFH